MTAMPTRSDRQQLELQHPRDRLEMPPVRRRHLLEPQPLGNRDDGGVNEPQVEILELPV